MKKNSEQNEVNSSLKLIFKSSLFVFVVVLFSKFLTYAYRVIIARYFGPEIYGVFSLAMMILLFLVAFSTLGLIEGVLRFVSLYRGKKDFNSIRYIFRVSMIILFFSSLIAGAILFLVSDFISINFFHEPNLIPFLKIFSFLIPIYVFLYFFLSIIQAFEHVKTYSFILDFLKNFFKLIFLILLIALGLGTNAVIFSYALGVTAVFLVAFFYCKYKISEIFKKYSLKDKEKIQIKQKLFSYSWPLIFSTILYGIFPSIDSITLGYFKGAFDVGLYNAAIPISTLMVLVPSLFIRIFFPIVTKEFSQKKFGVIQELSKQTEKWILIVNIPLLLLMIIFPGTFINILFGAKYLAAQNALRILAIGFFFNSLSVVFYNLISMVGKSKLILINILFTSFLNIILNILFIPKYGITGAAIATTISQFILSLLFFFQVKKFTFIIPLRRKMIQVILSGIISAIMLIYIKQYFTINNLTILLQGSFFILSYLLLIFVTRSLDRNDLTILRTIQERLIRQ